MYANVHMVGTKDRILELAVRDGIASSKTDALGIGLLILNEKYGLLERAEDIEDNSEAEAIMQKVRTGKTKTYSEKELMAILGKE